MIDQFKKTGIVEMFNRSGGGWLTLGDNVNSIHTGAAIRGLHLNFNSQMTALPLALSALNATYTRNSVKHVLQNGALVQLAANQFGTSFDSDPLVMQYGYLPETAATNLLQNSGCIGGGVAPTNWTGATGISAPATSTYNPYCVAYSQTAAASRPYIVSNSVSVSANTVYIAQMYVESISASVIASQCISFSGNPAGSTISFPICEANPSGGVNGIVNSGILSVVLTVGATAGTASARMGLGVAASMTGTIRFSSPQLETGTYPSTWILTPIGGTATRAADVLSVPLANVAGFNAAGYTMFVDGRTIASIAELRYSLALSDTTATNYAFISRTAAATVGTDIVSGGVCQSAVSEISQALVRAKMGFSCSANSFLRTVNGTSGTADTSGLMPVSPTTLYIGCLNGSAQRNGYIFNAKLITTPLTQSQLNAITTL